MRRSIRCTAAYAVCVTLALGAAAVPCAASDGIATTGGTLTRLSPASRQVLVTKVPDSVPAVVPVSRRSQAQPGSGGASQPFLRTTRGKVTLALMGAGVGLTLWSIQHDRKPVKSPIR